MTQEALKQMYQLLLTEPHAPTVCAQLERIARNALAEHAMSEVQKLGQKIEPKIGCVNHDCDQCKAQRTWVGLTDEEQQQAYEQWQNDGWGVFYSAIEAKLKEKNT